MKISPDIAVMLQHLTAPYRSSAVGEGKVYSFFGKVILLSLLCASCRKAHENKAQALPLIAGQPIHQTIASSGSQTYVIHLPGASYSRVSFDQRGIDLNVTLLDQTGREIATLTCRENEPARQRSYPPFSCSPIE